MTKSKRYDMVVIGGGAGGLVASGVAAGLGAKTLLVEKADRLGGECSWTGCVPSKALIHLASVAHELRTYGAPDAADELSGKAFEKTRKTVKRIATQSNAKSKLEEVGVEVVFATPRFIAPHELEIDGEKIYARRVILSAGSSPSVPDIPGLEEAGYLTNQNLFDLETIPKRFVVVGGGPIGLEMAQAFQRLGSKVTVIGRNKRLLPKDDIELAVEFTDIMREEGLEIFLGTGIERVDSDAGTKRVHFTQDGTSHTVECDDMLIATGRRANVEGLGLENLGIEPDPRGIKVSRTLQTKHPWLLCVGDIIGHHQFSHMAEHEAVIAVQNAFFPVKAKPEFYWSPWATFTEPELAHLGPTEDELKERGVNHRVYRFEFSGDDRARTDLHCRGMVKLLTTPGGRILGAHILGPRAGELMNEITLGAKKGAKVSDLAMTIHIYPTLGGAIQRAADHWFEEKAGNPWLMRLMRLFTRRV